MKYEIIQATTGEELVERVNVSIEGGWKPQGGVSVNLYGLGNLWYAQAMVKV